MGDTSTASILPKRDRETARQSEPTETLAPASSVVDLAARARIPPNWPRRMKIALAAAYVDESETKFRSGVQAKKWPEGLRDGGNVFWYREDLDAALDRLKPGGAPAPGGWGDYVDGAA